MGGTFSGRSVVSPQSLLVGLSLAREGFRLQRKETGRPNPAAGRRQGPTPISVTGDMRLISTNPIIIAYKQAQMFTSRRAKRNGEQGRSNFRLIYRDLPGTARVSASVSEVITMPRLTGCASTSCSSLRAGKRPCINGFRRPTHLHLYLCLGLLLC